jgi:hypothetical protein
MQCHQPAGNNEQEHAGAQMLARDNSLMERIRLKRAAHTRPIPCVSYTIPLGMRLETNKHRSVLRHCAAVHGTQAMVIHHCCHPGQPCTPPSNCQCPPLWAAAADAHHTRLLQSEGGWHHLERQQLHALHQGQHSLSCIELHHMQAAACSSNLDICVSIYSACDGDAWRTIMTQRHVPNDLYEQPNARLG